MHCKHIGINYIFPSTKHSYMVHHDGSIVVAQSIRHKDTVCYNRV